MFPDWFQFLYGSIKRGSEESVNVLYILFQFLYGSIKRATAESPPTTANWFQFLYGSIKSFSSAVFP